MKGGVRDAKAGRQLLLGPPSCCAPFRGPKKKPGCYFSGLEWGNWGSKKSFRGPKKRAEGAKKIISGGEKNKVVGRPHARGQKNNLRQGWGRKNNHGGRKKLGACGFSSLPPTFFSISVSPTGKAVSSAVSGGPRSSQSGPRSSPCCEAALFPEEQNPVKVLAAPWPP